MPVSRICSAILWHASLASSGLKFCLPQELFQVLYWLSNFSINSEISLALLELASWPSSERVLVMTRWMATPSPAAYTAEALARKRIRTHNVCRFIRVPSFYLIAILAGFINIDPQLIILFNKAKIFCRARTCRSIFQVND